MKEYEGQQTQVASSQLRTSAQGEESAQASRSVSSVHHRTLAQLAALANGGPRQAGQLQQVSAIHESPRQERLQSSFFPKHGANAPIQRVVLVEGDEHIRAYKKIWDRIKEDSDIVRGDGVILQAIHGEFPEQQFSRDELKRKIAAKRKPPQGTKRKSSDGPPANYQPRVTDGIGQTVDFERDRAFRPERRLRRRVPLEGRNVYTVTYLTPGESGSKRQKIMTISQPPGSLPKDHAELPEDELIANTIIGHSEARTDDIEKNYEPVKRWKRLSEATTREQCKDCRHHYPSTTPGQHFHGFLYSAPEDHIKSSDLRKRVIANGGKKGDMKFSKQDQADFTAASSSATYARQYDPDQNPAMMAAAERIEQQSSDSSDEYSDDEDPIWMQPYSYRMVEDKLVGGKMGKAPVFMLPAAGTFSKAQATAQREWIEAQRRKIAEKNEGKSDDEGDLADDEEDVDEDE